MRQVEVAGQRSRNPPSVLGRSRSALARQRRRHSRHADLLEAGVVGDLNSMTKVPTDTRRDPLAVRAHSSVREITRDGHEPFQQPGRRGVEHGLEAVSQVESSGCGIDCIDDDEAASDDVTCGDASAQRVEEKLLSQSLPVQGAGKGEFGNQNGRDLTGQKSSLGS